MNAKQRFFLDTKIFIYSFDNRNTTKRDKARSLIKHALKSGLGFISSQVIQEFFNVATRKFTKPFKIFESEQYLKNVLSPLCDIFPDSQLYYESLVIHEGMKTSFYDSLIISAAIRGKANILYSEDFQTKREYQGVTIVNPFA